MWQENLQKNFRRQEKNYRNFFIKFLYKCFGKIRENYIKNRLGTLSRFKKEV